MKLTTALLLFTCFQVSAKVYSQNTITLKLQSTELKKALSIIERKSSYRFLYNDETVKSGIKVDIDANNTPVIEVLDKLFANRLLAYKILENNLVVITGRDMEVQETKLNGKVSSAQGEALQGVSVKVKSSNMGTQTDANGNFSLTVPDKAVLIISYVGYETQEVPVNGRTDISISLKASEKVMDQVVVIGYGTASKRDLTGSIVKVMGKDIADKPNTNPIASLQGKVSGLSVVNAGELGKEPDIRIRGTVSKTQTKPLYVVDGIFNDNIDYLNPADIESIEVLKDPSSLAIFGVRGANGVIVVTSKKGKTGQLTVNFNSNVGVKKIVDRIKLVDASGFKTLYTEQLANQGSNPYPYFNLYNGNSNWQKLISQDGFLNYDNISLTSGTERNKFYMGLGYKTENGIIKHENLQKYILTLNDELKVSQHMKIGFNFNGYKAKNPQTQSFGNAISATPIVAPYNSQFGVYNRMPYNIGDAQVDNPLRVVEETQGQDLSNTYRVIGNIYGEATFLKKFTFKATYYTDLSFNENRHYIPLTNTFDAVANAVTAGNTKSGVSQRQNRFTKFQQDYLLTYKNQFGDHGLTVLGGFSTNYNAYTETNGQVSQFTTGLALPIPNDKRFWYLDNFYADPSSRVLITPEKDLFGNYLPYEWEQTTVSFLARALYNYKGKYMLNASFRRDGSSDISPAHKYQNFEAVGIAWEISKEGFMQNQKTFDYLKLKASWGILGNQYTAIHYPFYPLLTASGSAVFGPNGGVLIPGYAPSFIADPNLQWETINSTEVGVEFALLKNRLSVDANYFNKVTDHLLTNYPAANGQKPGITNAGKIANNGLELSLTWRDRLHNGLGYSVSGNITTLHNKVKQLFKDGFEVFDGPTRTRAGDPIGSFYGYIVDGVYQDAADSAKSPNNGYHPGDLKFHDVNGDGKISADDRTVIGNPTPKFIYGFSIALDFKGFDFSADFQGVSGNQIFRAWGNGAGYATLNYREARLNRWHGAGTSNWEPQVNDNNAVNRENSTYMIESGSYLRIRNLQFGYNFKPAALAKAHIKSFRVFIGGQNLKTFKHNSGFTPEFGGSATQFGVDNGSYPVPAVYTAGVNLNF